MEITNYDKTAQYEEIQPLIKQIHEFCVTNDIPCSMTFAIKNNKSGTEYKNEAYMPISAGINLKNDYLSQILLAVNGGRFIPPSRLDDIGNVFEADPDDENAFDLGTEAKSPTIFVMDSELPVQGKSSVEKKGRPKN